MLDLKFISLNKELVKKKLTNRGEDFSLNMVDDLVDFYNFKKELILKVEALKRERNETSSLIPSIKKNNEDVEHLFKKMRTVGDEIKKLDQEINDLDKKINYLMLRIPNLPHDEVPEGDHDSSNVEVRKWGIPTEFDFEIKPHWDIANNLDILDFERSSKVTGSRFVFYKGMGARLIASQ